MFARVSQLNESLAVRVTEALGTMWCAYAFVVLCLLPLSVPPYQSDILYVSNCFQLVFLPLLMVSNMVQGRKAEQRAEQDHQAILESHQLILEEVGEIRQMHAKIIGTQVVGDG